MKEKLESYLKTHKRPVDSFFLADRFLVNRSYITKLLNELEKEGAAYKQKVSSKFVWSGL